MREFLYGVIWGLILIGLVVAGVVPDVPNTCVVPEGKKLCSWAGK